MYAFSATSPFTGEDVEYEGREFNHFALFLNKLNIIESVRQFFWLTL